MLRSFNLKKLFLIAAVILTLPSQAQMTRSGDSTNNKWTLGGHAGVMLFYDDVKQYVKYPSFAPRNEVTYGLGLRMSRQCNNYLGCYGDITYGKLAGAYEPNKAYPNRTQYLYVTGNFFQFTVGGILNISNAISPAKADVRRFFVLASAGVGFGGFYMESREFTHDNLLDTYGKDGSRVYNAVLPVALGIKYKVKPRLNLGFEMAYHFTSSDMIDFVKTGSTNDNYLYANVSVGYQLHIPYSKANAKRFMQDDSLFKNLQASTKDKDKDGVSNLFDKDTITPEKIKTYGDGTAIDSDMDGIPDYKDSEPFSNKGAKVDASGRELDGDGDKVPDSKDLEPNTATGAFVDAQGRTIKVESEQKQNVFHVPSIYFGSNSAVIKAKYKEDLSNIALLLKENPELTLIIIGNADAKGNQSLNPKMGMKRAQAVAKYLTDNFGINSSRYSLQTNGSSNLLSPKDDVTNRRVDFKLKNK